MVVSAEVQSIQFVIAGLAVHVADDTLTVINAKINNIIMLLYTFIFCYLIIYSIIKIKFAYLYLKYLYYTYIISIIISKI